MFAGQYFGLYVISKNHNRAGRMRVTVFTSNKTLLFILTIIIHVRFIITSDIIIDRKIRLSITELYIYVVFIPVTSLFCMQSEQFCVNENLAICVYLIMCVKNDVISMTKILHIQMYT